MQSVCGMIKAQPSLEIWGIDLDATFPKGEASERRPIPLGVRTEEGWCWMMPTPELEKGDAPSMVTGPEEKKRGSPILVW